MKKELRIELIYSKLKELKNSLYFINSFLPSDYTLLDNRKDKNALYKEVEFAIQLVIDICSVINSDIGKTIPSNEDNIILQMEKEKILSKKISNKILLMKGFRNLLVHKYGDIDDKKAFENIRDGLKDFEQIIEEIERFLKDKANKKA